MQHDMFDLTGETAVVIGGTGALGGAIALGLARAGAKIAVVGRSEERGAAAVASIRQAGGEGMFAAGDAADTASMKTALDAVTARFGVPGVLVNGAGGNDPSVTVTADLAFEDISPDAWRGSFDLNLVGGALIPCQVFGRAMLEAGRGSIINIASVSAHLPLSRVVAYSAAKAAVVNLTQFLAREWAGRGVRVNSITPGFFPAEQNRKLLFNDDGSPSERARQILGHTGMGRFGTPDELAGAAVFLASAKASGFVTGTDLRVDGGYLSQTI